MKTNNKLVHGIGKNDSSRPVSYIDENGKQKMTKEYLIWRGMLLSAQKRKIEISEEWKYFSKFEKFLENCSYKEGFVFSSVGRNINREKFSKEYAGFISMNLLSLVKFRNSPIFNEVKRHRKRYFFIILFDLNSGKQKNITLNSLKEARLLHYQNRIEYAAKFLKPNEFENGKQCIETLISFYEQKISELEKEE